MASTRESIAEYLARGSAITLCEPAVDRAGFEPNELAGCADGTVVDAAGTGGDELADYRDETALPTISEQRLWRDKSTLHPPYSGCDIRASVEWLAAACRVRSGDLALFIAVVFAAVEHKADN